MKPKRKTLYYFFVLLIFIFSFGPILWCFIISITPESEMLKANSGFLPDSLVFDNYIDLFNSSSNTHEAAFNGLFNSLKYASLTLLLGIPLSTITAYGLSRYEFKLKKLFLNSLLLTIVIPAFTTIIPIYGMFINLGLLDNIPMTTIIYISAFLPLNTWIMMNYIKELPKELWQAAEIDGFSETQIFFKIVLPLISPILITCTLIMFLMAWKQYMIPMILISSYNHKPITMIMSEFMTRYAIEYGTIATIGILAIIPPAIAAILFRKFLISGLTSGSLKN